jgi:hypothetical protein
MARVSVSGILIVICVNSTQKDGELGSRLLKWRVVIWPMKRMDFIMLAKFAKTEEFEIGLEAILWDSDPIDDRLRRQLRIKWP